MKKRRKKQQMVVESTMTLDLVHYTHYFPSQKIKLFMPAPKNSILPNVNLNIIVMKLFYPVLIPFTNNCLTKQMTICKCATLWLCFILTSHITSADLILLGSNPARPPCSSTHRYPFTSTFSSLTVLLLQALLLAPDTHLPKKVVPTAYPGNLHIILTFLSPNQCFEVFLTYNHFKNILSTIFSPVSFLPFASHFHNVPCLVATIPLWL